LPIPFVLTSAIPPADKRPQHRASSHRHAHRHRTHQYLICHNERPGAPGLAAVASPGKENHRDILEIDLPPNACVSFGLSSRAAPAVLHVKNRQSPGPMRRSHLQLCPARSDRRRERELQRSERPCGSAPVRRDRKIDRTCPRSRAGAPASRASCHFLYASTLVR
jgi:hypothetical protein